jgi:hypothetical protein
MRTSDWIIWAGIWVLVWFSSRRGFAERRKAERLKTLAWQDRKTAGAYYHDALSVYVAHMEAHGQPVPSEMLETLAKLETETDHR